MSAKNWSRTPFEGTATTPSKINLLNLLLFSTPLLFGLYALLIGQDTNWDLQNYHLYNPFAFLTDRSGHDIAVSFSVTYYNPILHIPFYYAVTSLPPIAIGFILGSVQGMNIYPLFGIARQSLGPKKNPLTKWFCYAIALMGMLGATFLSETGASFGDNILSILVLTAMWLILKFRDRFDASSWKIWIVTATAGILTGTTFGLKLPFAFYSVGMCLAILAFGVSLQRRFALAFVFGIGVLMGVAIAGGFWMVELWTRFDNPIFPHFNQYFNSPWADGTCHCDDKFFPKNFWMWVLFPFYFSLKPLLVGEMPFRDFRFPLLYLLAMVFLIKWFYYKLKKSPATLLDEHEDDMRVSATPFIFAFMLISYVLWLKIFSIYRYLVICEMLVPISAALILKLFIQDQKRWIQATLACFLFLVITIQPTDWGRRPWSSDYFDVQIPPLEDPDNTIILLAGYEPMSYMVPFFPNQVRFLRIQRYFGAPSNQTDILMEEIIKQHNGTIFTIYRSYEQHYALDTYKEQSLELDQSSCTTFLPGIDLNRNEVYYFCRIYKKS